MKKHNLKYGKNREKTAAGGCSSFGLIRMLNCEANGLGIAVHCCYLMALTNRGSPPFPPLSLTEF